MGMGMNHKLVYAIVAIAFFGGLFTTAYAGTVIIFPGEMITWNGDGDGVNWSDLNNWDLNRTPESCDTIEINNDPNTPVEVHLNQGFTLFNELVIGSDDTFVIDNGITLNHFPEFDCFEANVFFNTIVNNGAFIIFGSLNNNAPFNNNGVVTNCGSIIGNTAVGGVINSCTVGGELLPLDTTSLLLAGAQMTAAWMIPVIVSAVGIGLVLVRRKNQ